MSEKDLEQLKKEAAAKAKAAALAKKQAAEQNANAVSESAEPTTESTESAESATPAAEASEGAGANADEKAKAAAAAKAKAAAAAKAKAAALAKQKAEADNDAGEAALAAAGPDADPQKVAASAQAAADFQAEGATALPEGSDDKAKAIAAAKAKAAAAAKAKAAAAAKAKAGGADTAAGGDEEKAKAIAAAKAKAAAAAAAKAKAAGGATAADGDDDKAKAIAAAKAKAAALAKAKAAGGDAGADAAAEATEAPSPNQPYLDKYIKVIEDHLGKDVLEEAYINKLSQDVPTLVAKPETYYKIAEFLKYNEQLGFDYLSEHHGTDFVTHMEVYNHFYSYKNRQSVALKVKINRDNPEIDSLTPLWPGADWPERESYDLLGIIYLNHPNLTRIMLADDWVGHPLRKDYEQYDVEV